MKKILFIFALIMSMTFNMNAQVDTAFFATSSMVATTTDADSEIVVFPVYSGEPINSVTISFDIDGLMLNDHIILYINDEMYDSSIETAYDTIYSDSIDHIDTIMLGHPGLYEYDTVYVIDAIRTIDNIVDLFLVGHNVFEVGDSVYFIGIAVVSDSAYELEIKDMLVTCNLTEYEGIDDNVENTFSVYPNPTHNFIHIDGDFKVARVFDLNGRLLKETNKNDINLQELNSGVYFIRIDNSTFKIQKM